MLGTPAATMPALDPSSPGPRLTLRSRLEDLAQLWPWVETLAARYSLPDKTRYAIELCLEEALSNIVRHGFRGELNQLITVQCKPSGAGELIFTVEDQAPPFDPLAYAPSGTAPASIEDLKPGGQGIRLMRNFASRLAWEPLATGNRLTLAFPLPH
jgi:anti-sigma regulatory factor (Ser/Thr protein kinase)